MSQLFINTVGHNASGKTTVAKRLEADLALNRVNGDAFRDFVYKNIIYFNDVDFSYPSEKYKQLNPLVINYRFELSWVLLGAKQSVLYDGSGSTKAFRKRYLDKVRQDFPEVKTVLIWTDIDEAELLKRLELRNQSGETGKKWVKMYREYKKDSFEPPELQEADIILRYDQTNYNEIVEKIKALLGEN